MTAGSDGFSFGSVRLPFRLGDYLLVHQLGQGGMGAVFLARHESGLGDVGRVCVVKTIRSDRSESDEYARRFLDEARVVVKLTHRNICPVYEVGRARDQFFLAMEYVAGVDLHRLTEAARQSGRPIPEPVAWYVVAEALQALEYAHRSSDPSTGRKLGLVHRDVSPHNILVSFEGEVRLIDFGLAVSELKLEFTAPNVVMGKMQYMAPEQARGESVDQRADIFAMGVVLYELLSGQRYYDGLDRKGVWLKVGIGGHEPQGLANLDEAVADVVRKATAAEPDDRFQDGDSFIDAINAMAVARGRVGFPKDVRSFLAEVLPEERDAQQARTQACLSSKSSPPAASTEEKTQRIALNELATPGSGTATNVLQKKTDSTTEEEDDDDSDLPTALEDPTIVVKPLRQPFAEASSPSLVTPPTGSLSPQRLVSSSGPQEASRGSERAEPTLVVRPDAQRPDARRPAASARRTSSRWLPMLAAAGALGAIIVASFVAWDVLFVSAASSADGGAKEPVTVAGAKHRGPAGQQATGSPAQPSSSDAADAFVEDTVGEGRAMDAGEAKPALDPIEPPPGPESAAEPEPEAASDPAVASGPAVASDSVDDQQVASRRGRRRTKARRSRTRATAKPPPEKPDPVPAAKPRPKPPTSKSSYAMKGYLEKHCRDVGCTKSALAGYAGIFGASDEQLAKIEGDLKSMRSAMCGCAAKPLSVRRPIRGAGRLWGLCVASALGLAGVMLVAGGARAEDEPVRVVVVPPTDDKAEDAPQGGWAEAVGAWLFRSPGAEPVSPDDVRALLEDRTAAGFTCAPDEDICNVRFGRVLGAGAVVTLSPSSREGRTVRMFDVRGGKLQAEVPLAGSSDEEVDRAMQALLDPASPAAPDEVDPAPVPEGAARAAGEEASGEGATGDGAEAMRDPRDPAELPSREQPSEGDSDDIDTSQTIVSSSGGLPGLILPVVAGGAALVGVLAIGAGVLAPITGETLFYQTGTAIPPGPRYAIEYGSWVGGVVLALAGLGALAAAGAVGVYWVLGLE